jgi:Rrf2 family protein
VKITRQTEYAVRTMSYLSERGWDGRVPTAVIAESEDIPQPFLTKVISHLVTAGLVTTSRGIGGGVALARSPGEITLLQVIEAMEGPLLLSYCLLRSGTCKLEPGCAIHDAWADIQANLAHGLDAVTMAELVRRQDGNTRQ